jgi:hypothetical protein
MDQGIDRAAPRRRRSCAARCLQAGWFIPAGWFILAGIPALAEPEFRGMSYVPWHADVLWSEASDQSIRRMDRLGVDTVALNVFWFQDTVSSSEISEDLDLYSASLPSVERAIDYIHSRGMRVFLKPNLDVRTGEWRALIDPADIDSWFDSYSDFITAFAELAEAKDVAVLSVGTEMNNMENPLHNTRWRSLITDVRSRYGGLLTYSANHGPAEGVGGGYQSVEWWDMLDYIGIDAYFALTDDFQAAPQELQTSWESLASTIESWRTAAGLSQPVLFTEVGYRSLNGAATAPWGGDVSNEVDLREQADSYQALLETMWNKPWWDGAFWWNWDTDPAAGGALSKSFTPQGKTAQAVVADYYGGTSPPPAAMLPLLSSWESGLDGFAYGGFGIPGTTLSESPIGATQGTASLAITSPDEGFNWAAQATWSAGSGSLPYNAFLLAAQRPEDFRLEFDVTYDTDSIPQGSVGFVELSLAFNSEGELGGGWTQTNHLATTSGTVDETLRVSIPLGTLDLPLAIGSTWYQVNLALDSDWGSGRTGTIYIDNLRLVDASLRTGDMDCDGDADFDDIEGFVLGLRDPEAYELIWGVPAPLKGDTDTDGDLDFDDIAGFTALLGGGAARALPEPGTAVLMAGHFVALLFLRLGFRRGC